TEGTGAVGGGRQPESLRDAVGLDRPAAAYRQREHAEKLWKEGWQERYAGGIRPRQRPYRTIEAVPADRIAGFRDEQASVVVGLSRQGRVGVVLVPQLRALSCRVPAHR